MTSRIGFPHYRVQNPDVRANIAIYSNSELRFNVCVTLSAHNSESPTAQFIYVAI